MNICIRPRKTYVIYTESKENNVDTAILGIRGRASMLVIHESLAVITAGEMR